MLEHHPAAAWAQQLREAFPFDEAPRFLIRDNDGVYGHEVVRCLETLGIEEVKTTPSSPWQNAYVENSADAGRVDDRTRPVDLPRRVEMPQQNLVDLGPNAGLRPVAQPPPAGHARAAAQFGRQVGPRHAGAQEEQDAGQAGAIA